MRIHHASIGVYVPGRGLTEFVPAKWTIPENPFLGPGMAGLADFVPGAFTLPPQPAGIGAFVPAVFTLPPQPAGVGDFVGTAPMYQFPQNSVLQAVQSGGNPANWNSMGLKVANVTYGLGDAAPTIANTSAIVPVRATTSALPAVAAALQANPFLASQIALRQQLAANRRQAFRNLPAVQAFAAQHPNATALAQGMMQNVLNRRAMLFGNSGVSGLGCGCGCGGNCKGGMGQISTDASATFSSLTSGNWSGAWSNFMKLMQDPAFGTVPVWMIAGGALLAYAVFFSGGEHSRYSRGRRAYSAGRRAYA